MRSQPSQQDPVATRVHGSNGHHFSMDWPTGNDPQQARRGSNLFSELSGQRTAVLAGLVAIEVMPIHTQGPRLWARIRQGVKLSLPR